MMLNWTQQWILWWQAKPTIYSCWFIFLKDKGKYSPCSQKLTEHHM